METYFINHLRCFFWLSWLFFSGCTSQAPIPVQDPVTKSTEQLDQSLSQSYDNKLSIILGRLDGMNEAIVEGLTDLVKSNQKNKEMTKKSLGTAINNRRTIKLLNLEIKKLQEKIEELQVEETDEVKEEEGELAEDDFDVNIDKLLD